MATIIDAFVVEFGLDPTKFTEGQKKLLGSLDEAKKGAARTALDVEESGKHASRFFSELRKTALEFFAVFTAGKGLKEFITDTVRGEVNLGNFSKVLGISVERLSAWQGVAERAGGSAAGIISVLSNINSQQQRLLATGEAGPLVTFFRGVISYADLANKSAEQVLLTLADWASTQPPKRAAELLRESLGADPATIALILQGRRAIEEQIKVQEKLGITTWRDSEAGKALLNAWKGLEQSSGRLGQMLLTQLGPTLIKLIDWLTSVAEWAQKHPAVLDAVFAGAAVLIGGVTLALVGISGPAWAAAAAFGALAAAVTLLIEKRKELRDMAESFPGGVRPTPSDPGEEDLNSYRPAPDRPVGGVTPRGAPGTESRGGLGGAGAPGTESRGVMTPAETEAFIRSEAVKRNINPDIAVNVARSEGGFGFREGDVGKNGVPSSFGPFQLHKGGLATGPNAVGGLGDAFEKATGLDPSDPTTVKAQIEFALDQASRSGWGPWHGWKGTPWAGISAPPAGAANAGPSTTTNSRTTTIDNLHVHTQATDGEGVARSIGPAIERADLSQQANYGNF